MTWFAARYRTGGVFVACLLLAGLGPRCPEARAEEEIRAPAVEQELDGQGQQELQAFFAQLEDALGLLDALMYEDESKPADVVARWGEIVSESWAATKEARKAAVEGVKRKRRTTVKPVMQGGWNDFWGELGRLHRKFEWDVRNVLEAKQKIQLKVREIEKWTEQNKAIEKVWFDALKELAEGIEEGEWLLGHGSRKEITDYAPVLATCLNIARGASRAAKESNKTLLSAYKRHQLTDAENELPDKLLGWEIDPQCFMPYRKRVGEWQGHVDGLVDDYVTKLDEWWKGVQWQCESTILNRFSNMKGWKLEELETKVQDLARRLNERLR